MMPRQHQLKPNSAPRNRKPTLTDALISYFTPFFLHPVTLSLLAFLITYFYFADSYPAPPPPPLPPGEMSWAQTTITLPPRARGSYLITDILHPHIHPLISNIKIGLLHLFIQHTSCALSLNENWDSDVREDMTDALERIVPYDKGSRQGLYRHDAEGEDDMPAHIKSALIGASVTVPIRDGKLALGTWQGIWYLEFRRARHTRTVVATVQGEKM